MSNFSVYAGLFAANTSLPGDLAFMNSKARAAKALFTTPKASAPWLAKSPDTPLLARANAIARLGEIVSPAGGASGRSSDPDIDLSFATYGALDKLLTLAKASAESRTDATTRAKLADRFDKGLGELQNYLAATHGTKLNVGFDRLRSTTESMKILSGGVDTTGQGIALQRSDTIGALTGNETISISLSKAGRTDTVVADISTIAGPITLDAVAAALNTAVKSVPLTAADGSPILDDQGQPVPRYLSEFVVEKQANGRWGLTLKGIETEQVSLADPNAAPALVVAGGLSTAGQPAIGRVLLFENPTGGLSERTLAELKAIDGDASEMATMLSQAEADAEHDRKVAEATKLGLPAPPRPADASQTVLANMTVAATASDRYGNIFVVGTTSGDLDAQLNDGVSDLFLTKLDASGNVLWQRLIGTGSPTSGTAIAVDANGDVVVAGQTEGALTSRDQLAGLDSFVAKFRANGDELFTTQLDGAAIDEAAGVVVDQAGRIYLAGSVRGALPGGTGLGGRDGYLIQLDPTGRITNQRQVGTSGDDKVTSMALTQDGDVLLAVRQSGGSIVQQLDGATLADQGSALSLGDAHVTSIAIDAATGRVAIGGTATLGVTAATQANAPSGGTDGFVMIADSAFASTTVRYLGTTATDSVDSLAFIGGKLFAGGRTSAALGAAKVGQVDGFVARLDLAGGLEQIRQLGLPGAAQEAVKIAASVGGASALGKIGLRGGEQGQVSPTKLIGQTSLREGDHFFLKLEDSRKIKIDVRAGDTFETLAARIRVATSNRVKATAASSADGASLKLGLRTGSSIDVIAGSAGRDALAKLGLEPTRLYAPKLEKGGNVVRPGGTFALELDDALSVRDKESAGYVVKKLEDAVRTIQSAFRSLYWDETKARIASGIPAAGATLSSRQSAQIEAYKLALARLGG